MRPDILLSLSVFHWPLMKEDIFNQKIKIIKTKLSKNWKIEKLKKSKKQKIKKSKKKKKEKKNQINQWQGVKTHNNFPISSKMHSAEAYSTMSFLFSSEGFPYLKPRIYISNNKLNPIFKRWRKDYNLFSKSKVFPSRTLST